MNTFSFKQFLDENKLTAKLLVEKTGYNKNTFTKWNKLKSDSKLPQDFILALMKEFPDIDLMKYFPTHAEIIILYRERQTN